MTEPYRVASFVVPMRPEEPLDYLPQPRLALWTRRVKHDYAGSSFLATGGAVDEEAPFLEGVGTMAGTLDRQHLSRYASGEARVGVARDQGGLGNHLTRGATPGPRAARAGAPYDEGAGLSLRFDPSDYAMLSRGDALALGSDPALTVAWAMRGRADVDFAPRVLLALGTAGAPELAVVVINGGAAGDNLLLVGPSPSFDHGATWALPAGTVAAWRTYVLLRPGGTGYDPSAWHLVVDGTDVGAPIALADGGLTLGATSTVLGGCPGGEPADCLLQGLFLWGAVLTAPQLSLLHKFLASPLVGGATPAPEPQLFGGTVWTLDGAYLSFD